MRFGEVLKHARQDLMISRRHDEWLEHNSNATYSDEALALFQREASKPPRRRGGTVSASSLNSCLRKQQFIYLGLPELPPVPRTASIFHNGTFTHLRWQMAGLTAGWLREAEVPVGSNEWGLSGTMDGICEDDSVVEFKSINSRGYAGVKAFGAKEDHQFQLATYLMCTGRTLGRFVYENKDTQDYLEIPYELDEQLMRQVLERTKELNAYNSGEELVEPLEPCMAGEGMQYKFCPFNDRCLKLRSWQEAKEMAA